MKIDTTIVDSYLESKDVKKYESLWLYDFKTERGIKNIFQLPPESANKRKVVADIKEEIILYSNNFIPCNSKIWDTLFDNWREFLDNTTLDLIVGYPEPYDAVVKQAPDGKYHMIFDILCWGKYIGKINLSEAIQNLLTHELFHVMIENHFTDSELKESQGLYIEQLDAITFNEGFAHLVSYNQQEIDKVLWNGEKLVEVYNYSVVKMKNALQEKNTEKQEKYIYEANHGNYYDKYAAMCGMIYLGQEWQCGGNERLKELFFEGYNGFATKSIE